MARSAGRDTPRDKAETAYAGAFDRLLAFDTDGYLKQLRSAWNADPNYVQPFFDANAFYYGRKPPGFYEAWDSAASRVDDPALRHCLRERLGPQMLGRTEPPLGVRQVRSHADVCNLLVDLDGMFNTVADSTRFRLVDEAYRFTKGSDDWAIRRLIILDNRRQWTRLRDEARAVAESSRHPLVRAHGYLNLFTALHRLGDHAAARRAEQAAIRLGRRGPGAALPIGMALSAHSYLYALGEVAPDSATHLAAMHVLGDTMARAAAGTSEQALRNWYFEEAGRRFNSGLLVESLVYYDSALTLARRANDKLTEQQFLMRRGRALVKLGRAAEAERDLLAARAFGESRELGSAMEIEHNLLHLYEAHDPVKADSAARRFMRYAARNGEMAVGIMSRHDAALFLLRQGRVREAIALFQAMVERINRVQIEYIWAGEFYEMTGQLDSAAHYFRLEVEQGMVPMRALAGLVRLAQARGDHEAAIAYAMQHDRALPGPYNPEAVPMLPWVYCRAGRVDESIAGFQKARIYATKNGKLASWAMLSAGLAEVLLKQDARLAAHVADSAVSAARRLDLRDIELRAIGMRELAWIKAERGARRGQISAITTARLDAEQRHLSALAVELLLLEGEAWAELGQLDQALRALRRADEMTTTITRSLSAEVSRAGYRSERIQISNRALEAIARSQHPRRLELYSDWLGRRKARTLIDADSSYHMATPAGLRRALKPSEAIIDYTVLDSALNVLVVTTDGADLIPLRATPAAVSSQLRKLRSAELAAVGSQADLTRLTFDQQAAHYLWRFLLQPITSKLAGRQRLYIVPDGDLHLVPFDALVTLQGPAPRFLLDDYEIVLAPSLNSLNARGARARLQSVLVVTAAGAPAAEREARQIATVLEGRAQNTTAIVGAKLAGYDVIHFAVHARPNEREPSYSQLELESGPLYAREIETLPFTGKLVVLSACETANGRLLSGEGVLNLSRTFHTAGATATVATLWPIGAPTADFMREFYRELAQQRSASSALRSAKLYFRHSSSFSSPQYWAPFTLVTRALEPIV